MLLKIRIIYHNLIRKVVFDEYIDVGLNFSMTGQAWDQSC